MKDVFASTAPKPGIGWVDDDLGIKKIGIRNDSVIDDSYEEDQIREICSDVNDKERQVMKEHLEFQKDLDFGLPREQFMDEKFMKDVLMPE